MSTVYAAPGPGCYRCMLGVRVLFEQDGGLAICDYPLRAVRLPLDATRLLAYCHEERTSEELARHTQLPVKRVVALCDQLCRRGLLEAGPALPPAAWPCVSIIIPSHNRVVQLERCLRSLLALEYPASMLEVIIVDDASTDETRAMLQRFVEETAGHGWSIQIIQHAAQQGVGKGRNTGAEVASHDLLAYIDSDCVASPGWLKELVPAFQDSRTGAVGGLLRAYERESMVGRYEDVRSSLFMGLRAQEVEAQGAISYVPAANLLVRREAWQQLEGFAPLNFGEDVDFCRRLLAVGYRVRYLPYGTVYHDYRTRLRDFLRTRISYASSEAVLLRLHPHERRTLLLPPEQATFAALAVGGLWGILARPFQNRGNAHKHPFILAMILTLVGAYRRWRKVREQRVPVGLLAVGRATLRASLAYTYHLCRHLTRYYTLPMLLAGLLLPPLLPLAFILYAVVIGVDYARLHPDMDLGEYAFCSLLDDCAYGVGVILGCIKHRTWKPLMPVIKWRNRLARTPGHEY